MCGTTKLDEQHSQLRAPESPLQSLDTRCTTPTGDILPWEAVSLSFSVDHHLLSSALDRNPNPHLSYSHFGVRYKGWSCRGLRHRSFRFLEKWVQFVCKEVQSAAAAMAIPWSSVVLVTLVSLMACAEAKGSSFMGSDWGRAHATFYGGADASGTQGGCQGRLLRSLWPLTWMSVVGSSYGESVREVSRLWL